MLQKYRPVSLGEVQKKFGVNTATAQYHLEKLNHAGIVEVISGSSGGRREYGRKYRIKTRLTTRFQFLFGVSALAIFALSVILFVPLAILSSGLLAVTAWKSFISRYETEADKLLHEMKS